MTLSRARLPVLAALLGLLSLVSCVSGRREPERFLAVERVDFHDAKGGRLAEVALDSEHGLLVGQVVAPGGQAPAHPYIEARYFDAAGAVIATSHARLRTLPGSRVGEGRRSSTFELPAPGSGFDRVELAVVATHPEH